MESRKVNWKNVSIVLLLGAFGIIIGFIDRVVNHVGPVENTVAFFTTTFSNDAIQQIPPESAWYNTSAALATTANSGFSLFGIVLITLVAVVVMMTLVFGMRCAA